ncbi:unnamed protein product [Chrysoparadoxa australica]
MKVAIYSHSLPGAVDGVSRRFTSIIEELHKAGHEVLVFTLEKEPLLEKTLYPGTSEGRFNYVHLESTFHPVYPSKRVAAPSTGNLFTIFGALLRERPDVVHVTADALAISFGLCGKLLGIPTVSSLHTDVTMALEAVNANAFELWATNFKERRESQLLDGCATTSRSFLNKLKAAGVKCDHIVKTGVLVEKFRPDRRSEALRERFTFGHPEALLVVYVGRLAPEKGLEKLMQMVRGVDNCYLALVGDGPIASYLASLHGPANRIYCRPGFLSHNELPEVYASADVHSTCSMFETLGNTVLEAHACGIPVVLPRTQGFVDTVIDQKDGLFFDGTNLEEGAKHLALLRDDRELCRVMGAHGRARVLQQSPAHVTQDLVEWYKRRAAVVAARGALTALAQVFQLLIMVAIVWTAWNATVLPYEVFGWLKQTLARTHKLLGTSQLFGVVRQGYSRMSLTPAVPPSKKRK